jgi:thiamine kinase-like enzyme
MNKYITISDRKEQMERWKTVCSKLTNDNTPITVDEKYHINNDVSDFIEKIRTEGGEMILLKELKGSFGFPFQTYLETVPWFTKLILYELEEDEGWKENKYVQMTPEDKKNFHIQIAQRAHLSMNTEPKINSILNRLVLDKINPHLCLVYGTTTLMEEKHKPILDTLINRYKKKEKEYLLEMSNVMMNEWCKLGDASDYIVKNYKKWSLDTWRSLFFQLIAMLALLQEQYPSFRHNDLSMANILIQSTRKEGLDETELSGYYKYHIGGKEYYVPDIGFRVFLTDFDYATIRELGITNEKINNSYTKKFGVIWDENKSFDCHMMLNWFSTWTLRLYKIDNDIGGTIGQVKSFFDELIQPQYRGVHGRYLNFTRLRNGKRVIPELVPSYILENNSFFEKYRSVEEFKDRVFIEEYNIPKNT